LELQLKAGLAVLIWAGLAGCQPTGDRPAPEPARSPASNLTAAAPQDAAGGPEQLADEWDQKFRDDAESDPTARTQREKSIITAVQGLKAAQIAEPLECREKLCRLVVAAPNEAAAQEAVRQLIGGPGAAAAPLLTMAVTISRRHTNPDGSQRLTLYLDSPQP
jgi:hypothetical protein